jgi:hypothetical protein
MGEVLMKDMSGLYKTAVRKLDGTREFGIPEILDFESPSIDLKDKPMETDYVDVSLNIYNIPREKAIEFVKAFLPMTGWSETSVYFNEPMKVEDL